MDTVAVVAKMCGEEFVVADRQGVCRSRGFSEKAAASPKLLENLLLSEAGLAGAFGALSREELLLLHLLKAHARPVDLSFFARVYGASESAWRGTFTQMYQETFKKLRVSLVRRGLLFFADPGENPLANKPKLERLLFVFPREFHAALPPLIPELQRFHGPGVVNDSALRGKLQELLGASRTGPIPPQRSALSIDGGELRFGEKELRAEHLLEWQKAAWAESLAKPEKKPTSAPWSMDVVEAVVYAASQLGREEWFEPASLTPILKVFCHGRPLPDPGEICSEGWRWGCLAKPAAGGTCYRLAEDGQGDEAAEPRTWLRPNPKGGALVDLARIPVRRLEELGQLSRFAAGAEGLEAQPDPVKIGRTLRSSGRAPAALWLRENAPAFGRAFGEAEKKWGKHVVHENLLVAEVRDLCLRVSIEKAFSESGRVVLLPNGFLAFPKGLQRELEALVTKSGYVVRRVTADGPA